ncbi:unnamed protein product [Gongylonema pulchrum]|uniref:Glycosyltransferase family 92 protein n=1 Tax=Gongylonema pulchrum TaxID=637853 RepID=A0A183D4F4_9BILA|nr:unnamed protein product [Gongylonema pulchrum]
MDIFEMSTHCIQHTQMDWYQKQLPSRRFNAPSLAYVFSRCCFIVAALLCGLSLYYRTTNLWTLKNMGDAFLSRWHPSRLIFFGAFHRVHTEQNVRGNYVVLQFLGDSRKAYHLYCFSMDSTGQWLLSRAHVQRIHQGKRAVNDVCSMAGHIAECRVASHFLRSMRISTVRNVSESLELEVERVSSAKRHKLVVCMAPAYVLLEWRILLLGIETWLALGATKIIIPIQSISTNAYLMLKEYEKDGKLRNSLNK